MIVNNETISKHPWLLLGLLVTALLLLLIYMKKEKQMNFHKKLALLRVLIVLAMGSIALLLICIVFILLSIAGTLTSISLAGGVLFILAMFAVLMLYLPTVFRFIKAYHCLMVNLSKEELFVKDNADAVQQMAKCTFRLLLTNLFFMLINCLMTLSIGSSAVIAVYDYGFESWTGQFLAALLLNLTAVIFVKSIELYNENRLTI